MQKQTPPNRMRELRRQHDLQLYDISAMVRYDTSTVQRWETGETATVPDEVKIALAKRYGVTVEYLMGWDLLLESEPVKEPAA